MKLSSELAMKHIDLPHRHFVVVVVAVVAGGSKEREQHKGC